MPCLKWDGKWDASWDASPFLEREKMARVGNKLSARKVETVKEIGKYSDGNGLYLRVAEDGKRWLFMGTLNGKRIELGLGSALSVSLADARDKAAENRALLAAGKDPRKVRKEQAAAEAAKNDRPTFGDFTLEFIDTQKAAWRNDKHRDQWIFTMSVKKDAEGNWIDDGYCLSIRKKYVDEIDTEMLLEILKPIWTVKPETARRVRGRIETILDAAKARGKRSGENPARWRGHLDHLLPAAAKLSRGHHSAMPFSAVPAYVKKLQGNQTISNLALTFAILNANRSGEVLGAQWPEFDMGARVWHIPAERMKNGKAHDVPLSDGAIAILEEAEQLKSNDFVFPGARGKQLSVMALTMAMRRTGAGSYTPHGFRSAFRDWAGDETNFQRDDIEQCLAHTVRDKTERAYRRSNALLKRRQILDAWWKYLSNDTSNVTNITDHKKAG